MTREYAAPYLRIYEHEGQHGRYFEAYDARQTGNSTAGYLGSFDTGEDVCRAFAGRSALVYSYAAYDKACADAVAADPKGFDLSDVRPDPVLCLVRTLQEEDA